jgi:uncharacterized protein with FMN-binding domain
MLHTLKRFLLSISVIGLFALYALQQQTHPLTGAVTTSTDATQPVAAIARAIATSQDQTTTTSSSSSSEEENEGSVADEGEDSSEHTTNSLARIARTPTAVAQPTSTPTASGTAGTFKDGSFTGISADASWGNVQVQVTVANGRITDVSFLTYPNHRNRSVAINDNAMPILIQEAISAQSSQVDIVSGATDTSEAFIQSLDSALQQAAA